MCPFLSHIDRQMEHSRCDLGGAERRWFGDKRVAEQQQVSKCKGLPSKKQHVFFPLLMGWENMVDVIWAVLNGGCIQDRSSRATTILNNLPQNHTSEYSAKPLCIKHYSLVELRKCQQFIWKCQMILMTSTVKNNHETGLPIKLYLLKEYVVSLFSCLWSMRIWV